MKLLILIMAFTLVGCNNGVRVIKKSPKAELTPIVAVDQYLTLDNSGLLLTRSKFYDITLLENDPEYFMVGDWEGVYFYKQTQFISQKHLRRWQNSMSVGNFIFTNGSHGGPHSGFTDTNPLPTSGTIWKIDWSDRNDPQLVAAAAAGNVQEQYDISVAEDGSVFASSGNLKTVKKFDFDLNLEYEVGGFEIPTGVLATNGLLFASNLGKNMLKVFDSLLGIELAPIEVPHIKNVNKITEIGDELFITEYSGQRLVVMNKTGNIDTVLNLGCTLSLYSRISYDNENFYLACDKVVFTFDLATKQLKKRMTVLNFDQIINVITNSTINKMYLVGFNSNATGESELHVIPKEL